MNPSIFLSLIPIVAGMVSGGPAAAGQSVTRMVDRGGVVFRVPVMPRPDRQTVRWVEEKGPKCVPTRAIRKALLSGKNNVDFVLGNQSRIRAKVDDDCPALDFYAGLYLSPDDEFLCVKRDSIRSRMGGSCQIRSFRLLQPRPRD